MCTHGPIPGATAVAATDAQGPSILSLSRGLAVKSPDGTWRYECPARWGGPESPRTVSSPEGLWIAGNNGVVLRRPDGIYHAITDALDAGSVRALVAAGGAVFALTGFSGGSTVTRVAQDEPPTPLVTFEETVAAIAVEGERLVVLFRDDAEAWLEEVDPGGSSVEIGRWAGDFEGSTSLRLAGGRRFVQVQTSGAFRLALLEDDEAVHVATSTQPIHGPVSTAATSAEAPDGAFVIGMERTLRTLPDLAQLSESERVTCLGGPPPYACILPDLAPLTPTGPAAPVFRLAELRPPTSLDDEACALEWTDFAVDAGLDPAPDVETTPSSESSGCAAAPNPGPTAWILLLLYWASSRFWKSRRKMSRIRSNRA